MDLCDRLEVAQKNRENLRDRLVAASLHQLNQFADSNEEFFDRARFYFDNLAKLSVRSEHIKQLRQTILNLAVCGKLVPQNSNDESAVKLLNRIQLKKNQLLEEGLIKNQKSLMPLTSEEFPFVIPKNWIWVRLSDITDVQDPNPSHRMPQYVLRDGVPFISSENFVDVDDINFQIGKRVSQTTLEEQISRFNILAGALAFTRIGTIGKSRFLPLKRNYCLSHAVCVINPLDQSTLSMKLLRVTISSNSILVFAHRGTRSIGVPDLGMGVIRSMMIPLPPLAEQHRIVSKVDELMALCDQLESQINTTQSNSQKLLESLLNEALSETA
jgi:type I restriction enzyme, S subunit